MAPIRDYLRAIEQAYSRGDASEHTYRPALKALLESSFEGVTATNEPRRIECGAPDYIVSRGYTPLGYIEAKDVNVNLNQAEQTAQLDRYKASLSNLLLTDYLEFRWYVGGEFRRSVRVADVIDSQRLRPTPAGDSELDELLNAFIAFTAPIVRTPADLATRMAGIARQVRYSLLQAFREEQHGDEAEPLHRQLRAFREVLIEDLTPHAFADMYAQTICYGLFAARANQPSERSFDRRSAAFDLPPTNPFLRTAFGYIAGPELHSGVAWVVDDLADLLQRSDMPGILRDFGQRTRQEDPVVHFYETFLAAYDPSMREARGVYYTPEPVVSYIVQSVDHLLRSAFGLERGLADSSTLPRGPQVAPAVPTNGVADDLVHRVQILDPATGTGTFLHGVIDQIHSYFEQDHGLWSGYVDRDLLPRLHAFELLMAPYTIAHMKIGIQLRELGYDFSGSSRLNIFLTNSLEESHEQGPLPLFGAWLAQEANAASRVKRDVPVMVILGNPPYSGHSANTGEWIHGLMRGSIEGLERDIPNYFEVDGAPLGERNPKWLNDDYVKFIRFAHHRIEETGQGIVAFVTNHGYLENPTFRGMRESLLRTFDEIFLLDLHGNIKKRERSPNGAPDEGVFDIQQGVAIGVFVKTSNSTTPATVKRADLWGPREHKYEMLMSHDVSTTTWSTILPSSPYYLFVAQDEEMRAEYEKGHSIPEIFNVGGVGVVTARDAVVIKRTPDEVWNVVSRICEADAEVVRRELDAGSDSGGWSVAGARGDLRSSGPSRNRIVPILYRPFDLRYTYYTGASDGFHSRPRPDLMAHMLIGDNFGLVTARSNKSGQPDHFFVSATISEAKAGEATTQSALFPLYVYSAEPQLFASTTSSEYGRRSNLAEEFIRALSTSLRLRFVDDGKGDLESTFGPEDVLDFIYAVFFSGTYRARYAEFLKLDFPRVPVLDDVELFRKLAACGNALKDLHLMRRRVEDICHYPVAGSNLVDRVLYAPADEGRGGRIYINDGQYFDGVPAKVWEYHVGGYQVLNKWLKGRSGVELSFDELAYFKRLVSTLVETLREMISIDELIEDFGGWPLSHADSS